MWALCTTLLGIVVVWWPVIRCAFQHWPSGNWPYSYRTWLTIVDSPMFFFYSFVRLRESRESLFIGSNQISHNPYKQEHILGYTIHSQTQKLIVVEEPQQHKIFKTGNISKQQKAFGFSEDRLPHWPLNPLVNHHFPYQMAIIGGISFLGTNPFGQFFGPFNYNSDRFPT